MTMMTTMLMVKENADDDVNYDADYHVGDDNADYGGGVVVYDGFHDDDDGDGSDDEDDEDDDVTLLIVAVMSSL